MARLRRFFVPGVSAHIIKRGNNRASIFSGAPDYRRFLAELADAAGAHGVAVHGYVLMTNHIHVVATPDIPRAIPAMMKRVGERYSRYFNRRYDRIGTPWCGRYKALLLEDERYWLTCLRYVEQNPVRAKMVVQPDDYEWSSYSAHASGTTGSWLRSHPLLDALGRCDQERAETYRRLCAASVSDDEVRRIRNAVPQITSGNAPARQSGSDPGV
jgi:putative transposase